jgi:hypothetical protein
VGRTGETGASGPPGFTGEKGPSGEPGTAVSDLKLLFLNTLHRVKIKPLHNSSGIYLFQALK